MANSKRYSWPVMLKRRLRNLANLPIHPQWLALRKEVSYLDMLSSNSQRGVALDIGCADRKLEPALIQKQFSYIGLDYPGTALDWYRTTPHIFSDAHSLPFQNGSIDLVFLLDVLEHLRDPTTCIREIFRVLKPEANLIIAVPFMYPTHDAPRDFHRWTKYGLDHLLYSEGLTVQERHFSGNAISSGVLLTNIGLAKYIQTGLENKKYWRLAAIPLAIPTIFCLNILGWLSEILEYQDEFSPRGITLLCKKI